jgi:hypothetical protein
MDEEEFIRMQQVTMWIHSIKIVPLLVGLVDVTPLPTYPPTLLHVSLHTPDAK